MRADFEENEAALERKRRSIAFAALWLCSLAWMALIFLLSSRPATQSISDSALFSRTLIKVLDWLGAEGSLTEDNHILTFAIRKAGHFIGYMVLAFLLRSALFVSLKPSLPKDKRTLLAGAFALSASAAFAVTDEIHQAFVPGRSMRLLDVAIDTAAAAFTVFIMNRKAERKRV